MSFAFDSRIFNESLFSLVSTSTVLLATKKVMEQLSAVYPELGRPGVTIPAAQPDGSIKREVSYLPLE